jgi:1-acyl-sn-glycerol-3-phosphate acyltransferase
VLHVRVEVEGPDPAAYEGRPLVVCCRHAGPGDSFLLVHALTNWYSREPRIVLKETLRWDPAIDVVLGRLPSRFISSRRLRAGSGRTAEEEIGELAHRLDHNDALVIFPEGGNFTEHRRMRAIEKLRREGFMDGAARAEAMRYVLAPKPGGVLAALDAAGEADVVWVAHTGTDHLFTVADVWRALPMDTVIRMRWWQVPTSDVPAGREARISWLFSWWEHIDAWIGEQRDEHRRRTLRRRLAERRAKTPH